MEKTKWILSAIMGIISTFTEHYGVMIVLVICAIVFDFATGIIKAKINGTINSATGTKGLFKKVALLTCLFFGFFLDYAIPYMCSSISIELPFNILFCVSPVTISRGSSEKTLSTGMIMESRLPSSLIFSICSSV